MIIQRIFQSAVILAGLASVSAQQSSDQAEQDLTHDAESHAEFEDKSRIWEGSVTTFWDSRYVTEGRDNLDGSGIASGAIDVGTAVGFFAGAWYASGTSADFDEIDLFAGWAWEPGQHFTLETGYTWLGFLTADIDDHEFAVAVSYTGIPYVNLSADAYYSLLADGAFIEFAATVPIDLIPERLTIAPSVIFGANAGYVPDEHNGANNIQTVIEAGYTLTRRATLVGYVAKTWAIDRREGESLADLFWGGVALSVVF